MGRGQRSADPEKRRGRSLAWVQMDRKLGPSGAPGRGLCRLLSRSAEPLDHSLCSRSSRHASCRARTPASGEKRWAFVQAFTLDPNAPPLSEAQEKLVLGGEAPLWTELVSDEMVDARLWPRSAAIAERFWSPGAVTDSASLNERLPVVQNMLETFGLNASENQARMIARLTPDNITPLTQFVALTVPVRNYGLNRLADHTGDEILLTPAAIAAPDSFEANAFNSAAKRYAAGDQSLKASLQEKLGRYGANDAAFQALSGPASIEEVKPLSHQIAALSALGLEALQSGPRGKKWRDRAQVLLAEQDKAYTASVDFRASRQLKQPRGGLLIAIAPGIKALVSQAR